MRDFTRDFKRRICGIERSSRGTPQLRALGAQCLARRHSESCQLQHQNAVEGGIESMSRFLVADRSLIRQRCVESTRISNLV